MSGAARLDGTTVVPSALGLAQFVHRARVGSTMDEAHALAASGAPGGTLVVADTQEAGRGRGGKRWHSDAPDGLWATWLLRDVSPASLGVLSLRVGLVVAECVAPWSDGIVGLKWPNDVLLAAAPSVEAARHLPFTALGKLAGILVETRWRAETIDWVAIGIGINLHRPVDPESSGNAPSRAALPGAALPGAVLPGAALARAALRPGTTRLALVTALSPRLVALARGEAALTATERSAWAARDLIVERQVAAPAVGRVLGIASDGGLEVASSDGTRVTCRSGSLEVVS